MRSFTDESGNTWVADTREEKTPRHHGRWFLVFHSAETPAPLMAMPEVRWQTRASALRTIATMSVFELRRRLGSVRARHAALDNTAAAT
jgi:hypothetical protein